ncbi:stalk domain-containing protein [Paenibacillus chibensis]|uniref:stalk domain-containing protein n=1 Tax=Paenibacillus chibensis TaxID=59846 RepID=UPI000FD764EB|nr:stalk domain-containing protein [Paenibacillus chibensis]MEC0373161.1 stalk domain-containing protein [Paenibacillus chibensis]
MKKWLGLMISAAAALSLGTGAFAAPASGSDANDDVAKMYRVNHEMKFDLQGKGASLDGKAIPADKPILKGGRVYVPLRTLRQSGAADSVTWNAAKREVNVTVHPELMPQLYQLTFRIGSEDVYLPDGSPIGTRIPAPFLASGKAYVPAFALSWLRIAVSTAKDQVIWKWSDKVIEVAKPEWVTDQDSTTFTMLYQKDMNTPQYMVSLGSGGWLGETGQVIEKDISMDGRHYNRIRFTANLRPGPNPLMLTAISAGSKIVTVKRNVADASKVPVTILVDGKQNIAFSQPRYGYVEASPGQNIDISGDILQYNDLYDKLTVQVERFQPSSRDGSPDYEQVKSFELPIRNQSFAGSFFLKDPGSYLISVLSPAYIPFIEDGPTWTQWAEFMVEVE